MTMKMDAVSIGDEFENREKYLQVWFTVALIHLKLAYT
jgi:hypothetical protein